MKSIGLESEAILGIDLLTMRKEEVPAFVREA